MAKAYQNLNKATPQSMPIPGRKDMVVNNAGGYVFTGKEGKAWLMFNRFLVLGSEGGTYYQKEAVLTRENAKSIEACLKQDYKRVIDSIVRVSDGGLAPKNDPALFALAVACCTKNAKATQYAMEVLPKVARIGTDILHFASFVDGMRSWGRALRTGVGEWYHAMDINRLSYQVGKYQSRDGWSHRDVLRSCHYNFQDEPAKNNLMRWIVGKEYDRSLLSGLPEALELMKEVKNVNEVVDILVKYRAPMQIVPTEYKTNPEVWTAALPNLGIAAIVREMGNMTTNHVLDNRENVSLILSRLSNENVIAKSRIHPFKLLIAIRQYESGHSNFGNRSWNFNREVLAGMESAMYTSFKTVEPTGKRIYLALDVSGSMGWGDCAGLPITPREATAVMAMVNYRAEKNGFIRGFSDHMVDVRISPTDKINRVMGILQSIPMGGTDCSLPMVDAANHNEPVDAFVIYTDNETWAGNGAPSQRLEQYRQKMGINAKLVVCAMISTGFTIADPKDPFQMDVVGISADTPQGISAFIKVPDGEFPTETASTVEDAE